MALTTYTITIVNKNVAPVDVVGEGYKPIVVISPTGVTTPDTPYAEWVADNTSRLDGSVAIPAWKKLQYFILPASSKIVIATDISDEAAYYQALVGKFENVEVIITAADGVVPFTEFKLAISYATAPKAGGSAASVTATPSGFTTLTDAKYTIDVNAAVASINATSGALTAEAGSAGQVVTVTCTGTTEEANGFVPVKAITKVTIAE